jgi:hypothetical protein
MKNGALASAILRDRKDSGCCLEER